SCEKRVSRLGKQPTLSSAPFASNVATRCCTMIAISHLWRSILVSRLCERSHPAYHRTLVRAVWAGCHTGSSFAGHLLAASRLRGGPHRATSMPRWRDEGSKDSG